MRSNLDNNRARGLIFDGPIISGIENLAISAAFSMVSGMPYAVALDPASTGRVVTMYTPAVVALTHEHQLFNISTGTGALTVKDPTNTTTLTVLQPGDNATLRWVPSLSAWKAYKATAGDTVTPASLKQVLTQYTALAALANSQVIALAVPFAFTLLSVGFRTRIVASTAAKAATLTGQVNGSNVTGGVVSLTTANQNTSGTLTAGTAITAANTGTAGQTVGVAVSAVTAFAEGDGYVEFVVANTAAQ